MTTNPPPGPPAAPPGAPPMTQPPLPTAMGSVPPQMGGSAEAALFSGLDGAGATKDGNWVRPGHYIMRLNQMKAGNSTKGDGAFLATELTVAKVLGTSECAQAGTVPHNVGEQVTDMKMRKHKSFQGNVNAMLAGMEGMTFEALKADLAKSSKTVEQLATEAIGPSQPYAGLFFEVIARHIPTKPRAEINPTTGQPELKQGVFTRINYQRPVSIREVAQLLTDEEKAIVFPGDSLQQALAAEGMVEQAMGGGSSVVTMSDGVNYVVPQGWHTQQENPGWGWDGQQWHQLQRAS